MAVRFCQIVDSRFVSGNKESLRLGLLGRLAEIATNLKSIGVIQFAHENPRFLSWDGDDFQWRADCYVVKPRNVTQDQVFGVINQINPVHYSKISDEHANRMIAVCCSSDAEKAAALGFDSVEEMHEHEEWLTKHGTPEYMEWAAEVLSKKDGSLCAPAPSM